MPIPPPITVSPHPHPFNWCFQVLNKNVIIWMTASPQNSHIVILMLNVMMLWCGAFGRCLGHEGGALVSEISVLIKETPQSSLAPPTKCEATARGWQFAAWKRVFTRILSWRHPGLGLSASRAGRNKFLLCISHPVYSTLL